MLICNLKPLSNAFVNPSILTIVLYLLQLLVAKQDENVAVISNSFFCHLLVTMLLVLHYVPLLLIF